MLGHLILSALRLRCPVPLLPDAPAVPCWQVLSHPHFLLVTLLLTNAAAMETLPIFLDRLTNPLVGRRVWGCAARAWPHTLPYHRHHFAVPHTLQEPIPPTPAQHTHTQSAPGALQAAIVISVTAVLVFGEIVPQAVCKVRGGGGAGGRASGLDGSLLCGNGVGDCGGVWWVEHVCGCDPQKHICLSPQDPLLEHLLAAMHGFVNCTCAHGTAAAPRQPIPTLACVLQRYGLQVGARLAWLVRALMLLTAPVSYPIAMLLDYLLGEETALFR